VFYDEAMAMRVGPFLQRATARGAKVFLGDPGRAYLARDRMTVLASYPVPAAAAPMEPQITTVSVLQPR
jgi:predicted nicotinamide N-methyase